MDVKTKCLGMLFLGDASGYEIKKNFEEGAFSHFLHGSFGSIYPALASLSEDGLITAISEDGKNEQNGKQDRKREKKLYQITEAGREALFKRITGNPAQDRFYSEFLFQLIFAPHVSADLVRSMLDQRERHERQKAEELSHPGPEAQGQETPAEQFIRLFGAEVHRASAEFIAKNRYMLEAEYKDEYRASVG